MIDFSTMTLQEMQKNVSALTTTTAITARLYQNGDHWQKGKGHVGPRPSKSTVEYTETMVQIEAAQVTKGAIQEISNRHVSGVLGDEQHWKFNISRPLEAGEKPSEVETALIREVESSINLWGDRLQSRYVGTEDSDPMRALAVDLVQAGRGVLRVFIPPVKVKSGVIDQYATIEDALNDIYIQHLPFDQAAVITDWDTQKQAGIYLYLKDNKRCAEITYTGDEGKTFLRKIDSENGESVAEIDLGGRILMCEVRRPALIGEPQISQQRLIDMALTMLGRNVVLAGFLERVLLNVDLPGKWETNAEGKRVYVNDQIKVGAGVVSSFVGLETKNADQSTSFTTPDVRWREPVDVTTFERTKDIAYHAMLSDCHQTHILIAGDAVASSASRETAIGDFEADLDKTAIALNSAKRWMLETVLRFAATLSGQPTRYDTLRAYARCRINAAPISVERQRLYMEAKEGGFLPHEDALAAWGIQDVDSVMQRLEIEQEEAAKKQPPMGFDTNGKQTASNRKPIE